jgi:hypothetical protein
MKNIFIKIPSGMPAIEVEKIATEIRNSFTPDEYNFIILDNRIDTMSNKELYNLFEKIYQYKKELNNDNPTDDKQTTISDFNNTKC